MKSTTKRRQKSEAEIVDQATNNLLRALKHEMVKQEGAVDRAKLEKEGYSERFLNRLEES